MSFQEKLSQTLRVDHPAISDRRQIIPVNDEYLRHALRELDDFPPTGDPLATLRAIQSSVEGTAREAKTIPTQFKERMEEYQEALIGVGFVRFAGLENAAASIDISRDLDTRVNPRGKDEKHVQRIASSVRVKKEDWKHPIIIRVNPDLIDPPLRLELSRIKPFQEYSTPALFKLNNESDREQELQSELFWERSISPPYAYLTAEELAHKKEERDRLRAQRPRATLVNGSHRVDAMADVAVDFEPHRRRAIELGKAYLLNPNDQSLKEEHLAAVAGLRDALNEHTWQVLIFKDTTEPTLLNELATNTDPLPVLPAGEFEQLWMHVSQIELELDRIKRAEPALSRAEVMDRWRAMRLDEKAHRQLQTDAERDTGDSTDDQAELSKGRGRGTLIPTHTKPTKEKGGSEGGAMYQRISGTPVLLEMLLANKSCVHPLTSLLSAQSVGAMLKPTSGGFVAHFWISLEILQRLCNVSGTENISRARKYVKKTAVTIKGYTQATEIWKALHAEHQRLSEPLKAYNSHLAGTFEKVYLTQFGTKKADDEAFLERNWGDDEVVFKMRSIYEKWGIQLEKDINPAVSQLGVSARLYARLPGWSDMGHEGEAQNGDNASFDHFHPRAVLPASGICIQWARLVQALAGPKSGAGIELFEYLLDRSKHMWVFGSADSSSRVKSNWYNSNRGTLQAVLNVATQRNEGCIISRLSQLLSYIESPSFYKALRFVDKAVDPQHRIPQMRLTYGTGRQQGLGTLSDATLAVQFAERIEFTGCADAAALLERLKWVASHVLRDHIREGHPNDLPTLIEANPCLKVISDSFWKTAPVIWWGSAWNIKDKNVIIPACVIGWGLLLDAYEKMVVEHILLHRSSYHLVNTAQFCCNPEHGPWWGEFYDIQDLRRYRYGLFGMTCPDIDGDTELSESDPEDLDPQCLRVSPITGYSKPEAHVTKPFRPSGSSSGSPSLGSTPPIQPTPEKARRKKRKGHNQQKSSMALSVAITRAKCRETLPRPSIPVITPSNRIFSARPPLPEDMSRSASPSHKAQTPVQAEAHISSPRASGPPLATSPREAALAAPPSPTSSQQILSRSSPISSRRGSPAPSGILPPPDSTHGHEKHLETSSRRRLPPPPTSSVPTSGPETLSNVSALCEWPELWLCWSLPASQTTTGLEERGVRQMSGEGYLELVAASGFSIEEHQDEIREALQIPGTRVTGFLSDQLLPGFEGQMFFRQVLSPAKTLRELQGIIKRTQLAIHASFQARANLRQDILAALNQLASKSNPGLYVRLNLAPHIHQLKATRYTQLLNIKSLALEFFKIGLPLEDALAEAVMMAADDKLFSQEIFWWEENGDLVADISTTFPEGICKAEGEGKLLIANIEHPPDVGDTYKLLDRAMPGCVIQASSERGSRAHSGSEASPFEKDASQFLPQVSPSESEPKRTFNARSRIPFPASAEGDSGAAPCGFCCSPATPKVIPRSSRI